jgi:XTP/dITP diphosphohydrolase
VAALGGAPGVHSARFAGPDADDAANNALLLARLDGVPDRRARFVCALCLVDADGRPRHELRGTVTGTLLTAPRGTGGFGYDPLFFSPELGMTFAEAGIGTKSELSHRSRAMRAIKPRLLEYLARSS